MCARRDGKKVEAAKAAGNVQGIGATGEANQRRLRTKQTNTRFGDVYIFEVL